jgi:subtilisin family serine protease
LRTVLQLSTRPAATGRDVRIAVIDSGVHAAHPHVQGVSAGIGIDHAGRAYADYVDRLGHGTAVAAVIREKAPAAALLVVKVFDTELRTTGDALVAALRWARDRGARLANLSLGTTNVDYEAALAHELDAATRAGMLVLSAGPHDDVRWLPGSLPGAIAVQLDMAMPRDRCAIEIDQVGRVTITACGYPRPIPGVPPERNLKGVSFAVANASGLLARLLEATPPGTSLGAALEAVS